MVDVTCVIVPRAPFEGPAAIENVSPSPSRSLPVSVIVTGVSSSVVALASSAIRCVVDRVDGDRHRGRSRVERAVVGGERERVAAVEVGAGRVGDLGRGRRELRDRPKSTVRRSGRDRERQPIAVEVAAGQRDRHRRVLAGGCRRHRRLPAASLTASTVIATVAGAESTVPSLAVNVNASLPLKSALGCVGDLGRGRRELRDRPRAPFEGPAAIENVSPSPSRSLPVSVIVTGVSSPVVAAASSALGWSLTASTVIVTVAGAIRRRAVVGGERELVAAVEVGAGCVGDLGRGRRELRDRPKSTVRRSGRDRERQPIAVEVAAGQRDRHRRVLAGGCRGIVGVGRVVDRVDGDRNRGRSRVDRAVVDGERELVAAVEVGAGV